MTKADARDAPVRLFHSSLALIPTPFRFILSGVLGNVFFMGAYNTTYKALHKSWHLSATRVFAIVQFVCIIVNHFLNVGLVFGWPSNYLASLLSNMPVGLLSLALGAWLAGYLEEINFDDWAEDQLDWKTDDPNEEGKSFYSSVAVMLATGVFNYIALNLVNSRSSDSVTDSKGETEKEKKDL